jgi:ATP-binding cassette, subfamily B, bacterial PglK
MIKILNNLRNIAGTSNFNRLFVVLLMTLIYAVIEVFSIALIIPVLAIITDQEILTTIQNFLIENLTSINLTIAAVQILIISGFGFVFIIKNIINVFLKYKIGLDLQDIRHRAHCKLFDAYLHMDYIKHTQMNSSELRRNIDEIGTVFQGYIMSLFKLTSEFFVILGIFIVLLINNASMAISLFLSLSLISYLIHTFFRAKLNEIGKNKLVYMESLNRHFYQGLSGIRDIKVSSTESFFTNLFSDYMWRFLEALRKSEIYSVISSILIETIVVIILLSLALFLLLTSDSYAAAFAQLVLFSVALIRVLSSVKIVITSFQAISFGSESLNLVSREFSRVSVSKEYQEHEFANILSKPVQQNLILKNINFNYPKVPDYALKNINLKIEAGTSVGIVGSSGSGKSTLIDILMNLISPNSGVYFIDDYQVNTNDRLSDIIGYVSQSIYLLDESIVNNIAFGISEDEIDYKRIDKVLEMSALKSFVETLPEGINTVLGENGVRMSGGQKQRIGIARALYKDVKLLIFDEATSSLDPSTEKSINDSIIKLSKDRTIIVVSHRMTSVANCENIIFMHNGAIEDTGSFNSLKKNNSLFREMANLPNSKIN